MAPSRSARLNPTAARNKVAGTKKENAQPLTKTEIEDLARLLHRIRHRITGSVSSLTQGSLQPMLTRDEDVDSVDHDFHLRLAGSQQDLIREIDAALERIATGSYGFCEMTGDPIGRDRLRAIPYARYSVAAQEKMEGRPARRRARDLL